MMGGLIWEFAWSPSIRREWIEMSIPKDISAADASPSIRREWIEMIVSSYTLVLRTSPSIRREWIEISSEIETDSKREGLPPYGGSGLKYR